MENKETGLTRQNTQIPAFVQDKLKSLEGALEYAKTLCASRILPAHFYGKKTDHNNRSVIDYDSPKPETVVVVLQYGQEIGMSPMMALQQLVPVNNRVGIQGDGAKALIMGSGKAEMWKEEEVGDPANDTWGFKITVKRVDTGEEKSSVFTVSDAKRAKLWITDDAVRQNGGLGHSPWYKYQKRMLRYRALGFIARDVFPDVLQGMGIEEEIRDYGADNMPQEKTDKIERAAIQKAIKSSPVREAAKPAEQKPIHTDIQDAQVVEDEQHGGSVIITQPSQGTTEPITTTITNPETETPVVLAVRIEDMNDTQLKDACKTQKEPITAWVDEKLGYSHSELFGKSKAKKTVATMVSLINAIKNDSLASWCSENGVSMGNTAPEVESAAEGEKTPFVISEPDRDFDACNALTLHLKTFGIDLSVVRTFLLEEEIDSTSTRFIETGSVEQIEKLIAKKGK